MVIPGEGNRVGASLSHGAKAGTSVPGPPLPSASLSCRSAICRMFRLQPAATVAYAPLIVLDLVAITGSSWAKQTSIRRARARRLSGD